jgi:hypothetical protein
MESTVTGDNFRELEEKVNWLVKAMSERMEREARVSREEVIRNPRLSGGVFSSSGTGGGGGGGGGVLSMNPVVDPREELFPSPNPPRRQGRYTLSPQVDTDEAKEPSDIISSRPAPAAGSDTLTAAQRRAGEERLLKKVKTPPTFSGNDAEDEISEVRDWVEVVDDFFDCMVGYGYDGEYALTFVKNNLRGPAHDWMKAKVSAFEDVLANGDLPQSMRQGLRWSEVKKLLVEAFESPQYQVMKRFELQELRLGQGKHKTLPIFNAAFDKLSRRLWPIGTDFENNVILDRVLADEYSTILERSDIYLWRDVVKTGPRTLSQWKASTAVVWSAREVLRTNEQRNKHIHGGAAGRGGGGRRNQFGQRPPGTAGAAAQEMDIKEESQEADSEEDTPGQAPAAVQQMQGRGANNRNRPQRGPRVLTDDQMRIVWEKNLCLQCYKPGHHRGDDTCEEKGKPRRKPLPGELKA